MSYFNKQAVRMYNNRVESLTVAGDCKKNLQKKLRNIIDERDYLEKSATIPIFEKVSSASIK